MRTKSWKKSGAYLRQNKPIRYRLVEIQSLDCAVTEITDSPQETLAKIETGSFVGQGIMLCECRVIESFDVARDLCCEISVAGKPTVLEMTKIIESYPVIEGEVSAGIYQFYAGKTDYYEIKDAAVLSKFFSDDPSFDCENEKLVCRPDRVSIYDIKSNEAICSSERHPLTFFDVYCPLCRQKIMNYETKPDRFECEELSLPCPHFVGQAVWSSGGYETEELDDLKINYRLIEKQLYFETIQGWQKPVIYTPTPQPLD